MSDRMDAPLYVGYLPMPPAHKRLVIRAAGILVLAALAIAGILVHFQRAPAARAAWLTWWRAWTARA
jgi:hypothetical protein